MPYISIKIKLQIKYFIIIYKIWMLELYENLFSFTFNNNQEISLNKSLIRIVCTICLNNTFISIIAQIFVNENLILLENIWIWLSFIFFIHSTYEEYFIHYNNESFGGVLNLFGLSASFSVLYCIYRTKFLYWLPTLYMKHFTNLVLVDKKNLFFLNEFINYVCMILFIAQYNILFISLTTVSSFFYSKKRIVGSLYFLVIFSNLLNLHINNIFVRLSVLLIEVKLILFIFYMNKN